MVPIAGVILAIVMTVDLIQMIADKNNLHDVDTWMIFKWVDVYKRQILPRCQNPHICGFAPFGKSCWGVPSPNPAHAPCRARKEVNA